MARIKTVFSSHQKLSHVWAQQTQEHGRASNMFFESTTDIYSYGRHYLAARMHTFKGKRFALVRSDTYSNSTSGHLADIRRALTDLVPYFCVEGKAITDPRLAVENLDSLVQKEIDRALARKFFADSTWKENSAEKEKGYHVEAINSALKEANELRLYLGRAPLKMPKTFAAAVEHLNKLVTRFNSPERQKRREDKANARELARVEQAKRYEEQRIEEAKKSVEQLANFRAGKHFGYIGADYDMLRISNDGRDVQTSAGAEVPLAKARVLFAAIEAGERESLIDKRIGAFTVHRFDTDEETGEEYIKIGCHRILLSEARAVLGKRAQLTLVEGA